MAGALLPSYAVGGDWFDFVENRDGGWLAIADASGNGPTAAGLGAAALGAVRASRRAGGQLEDALALMDDTVRRLEHRDFYVTAIVARWRAATATLRWVNCGHPPAYLIDLDGDLHELTGVDHPALGAEKPDRAYRASERQLHSGERLVLITDGITERHVEEGGRFGLDGLHAAIASAEYPTAAATAMAIHAAITASWSEPLEDDATVVVMAIA